MWDFFRKHMRIIFAVTIFALIGEIFLSTRFYFLSNKTNSTAKVNDSNISIKLYRSVYANSVKMYRQITNNQLSEKDLSEIKMRVFQALVQDEIFYQQSKLYGILVTNKELKTDLQNSQIFQEKNVFSKDKYIAFLASVQMTPKEYEILRKKQIAGEKLKAMLSSVVKLWDYELENAIKKNPLITRNTLLQTKINVILNEWYSNIIKNSAITNNELIPK
jgi:peptidyl-prolyl cis-trans isomerase D